MVNKFVVFSACLVVGLVCAGNAFGLITYVDVTPGNTTLTDGSAWTPLAGQSFVSDDGVWETRAFGNGGTIYQNAASGGSDDAHPLKTTIGGLEPGARYQAWVLFWSDTSQWGVRGGLENNPPLTEFYSAGGHVPATPNTTCYGPCDNTTLTDLPPGITSGGYYGSRGNPFDSDTVNIGDGNRRLFSGFLRGANADGSGNLMVFIDDRPATLAVNNPPQNARTWLDGVGYMRVPEPASIALLGLGLGALLVGRRR